jgi:hypothetical protein
MRGNVTMGPRGFGKTLKWFQYFTRKQIQLDLNPSNKAEVLKLKNKNATYYRPNPFIDRYLYNLLYQ